MRAWPLILTLLLSSPALAQAEPEEAIDYVNLAATLLKDGYLQRAKSVLDKADARQPDFDFARFYSLKGVLFHQTGYPLISNLYFQESIERGQDNPSLYLYMARNHWQRLDYEGVIEALNRAGEAAKEIDQMYVIKAEAYKQLGRYEEAWLTLDEGIARYPEFQRFYSQKFYYLMELGFFQQALEYADRFVSTGDYSAKDYLAVSYALRENNQFAAAAALLEGAVIRNPTDDKLIELLGQVYIDQEKYLMAALVFDWASIEFPRFANKAATLYLKAEQPVRSLQLNRRIIDQQEKFRQRLGIDIFLEDFESLVTKTEPLKRYDLLKDENILYALGYAYFKNGEYDQARRYLKRVTDNQLFTKASYLFQQMEKCEDDPLLCS